MHTLVGAGKTDGALDASNLLKPALARGEPSLHWSYNPMNIENMLRKMQH